MKVVTMGEMMIRFMPKNNLRFEQATEFEAYYGGDESIVAVSLARFGLESRYVTKLPVNPLGQTAVNKLREQGIDTSYIVRGGERMKKSNYGNASDDDVEKYSYDYYFVNDKTLEEAEKEFVNFLNNIN